MCIILLTSAPRSCLMSFALDGSACGYFPTGPYTDLVFCWHALWLPAYQNRVTCVWTRQSYTVIYETRSKIRYIDYSVVPFEFCTEYLRFEGINVEVDA